MEGIQTINALKAVQSSLPAQTTIPSDELVMLYAADGTPIAKIARDDLVKAVASVMASNSQTTFSKLLGVQANGTPMGIGASDLASVLGATATQITSLNNLDDILSPGMYYWNYSRPTGATQDTCFMKVYKCKSDIIIQEIYSYVDLSFICTRKKDGNAFSEWQSRPYFLNAYSDLSSLASALGVQKPTEYWGGATSANSLYDTNKAIAMGSTTQDVPLPGVWFVVFSINSSSNGSSCLQFAFPVEESSLILYARRKDSSGWSAWKEV